MTGSLTIGISPGIQEIVLNPGEVYEGDFLVLNPYPDGAKIDYEISVRPLSVKDELYNLSFSVADDYNQIVDWVTLAKREGTLLPKEEASIHYVISVPEDAPAGGQYLSFIAAIKNPNASSDAGISVSDNTRVASLLYATVKGETRESGRIIENNIPLFSLDTPIRTTSVVQNTGDVHGRATYVLQVFPLFSDEEVFTNAETPAESTIIPATKLFSEKTWDSTPMLGIYRVVQTIKFAGVEDSAESVSIVCPIWFLGLCILFIASVISMFINKIKMHKKP